MTKIPIIEITLFILRRQWVAFGVGVFIGMIVVPVVFELLRILEKGVRKNER